MDTTDRFTLRTNMLSIIISQVLQSLHHHSLRGVDSVCLQILLMARVSNVDHGLSLATIRKVIG